MSLRFPKVRLSRRASGCSSCGNAVEGDQLVCLECGTLQGSGARLGGAAWKMPVALVGALLLLMATGFGFASGAVGRDGEVTVAQAPPSTPLGAPPSADEEPEQEGVVGSGGSALPKLPGPSAAGSGRKLGFGGGSSASLDDALGGGSSDEPAPGSGGGVVVVDRHSVTSGRTAAGVPGPPGRRPTRRHRSRATARRHACAWTPSRAASPATSWC